MDNRETARIVFDEKKENVVAGIVGAFLFSLAGGVLWFLLYMMGFIAGISGIVGVICAIKGYALFAKKESVKGIVIAIIMAVAVLAIAWYFTLSYDVFAASQEWFANGEIDFQPTFFDAVSSAWSFLEDPEVARAYLLDLGLGILFSAVASVSYIVASVRKIKAKNAAAASAAGTQNAGTEFDYSSGFNGAYSQDTAGKDASGDAPEDASEHASEPTDKSDSDTEEKDDDEDEDE